MLTEKKAAQANRKEISYFVDLKHLKLIIDEVEIDYLEHKANKDFLFITINNKVEKISKNEELR